MSEQPSQHYPPHGLSLQQIINRLAHLNFTVTTPVANIFTDNVPVSHRRVITQITLVNTNNSPQTCRLRVVKSDATTRNWIPNINVQGLGNEDVNKSGNPLINPLMALSRGQNIDALRGGTINLDGIVYFYDIPRN